MRGLLPVLGFCCLARAEQLPVKTYTTADGLPRNIIHRIQQDRRGFLWISTPEGLAQFDGYRFKTYGPAQGLPDADVSGLLITRGGEYWVATRKGVCRFQPEAAKSSRPRFTVYQPGPGPLAQRVIWLAEDAGGHIWCSTYGGLYRLLRREGGRVIPEPVDLGIPLPAGYPRVDRLFTDRSASIWIGGDHGLYRRRADGRIERYTTAEGLPQNWVTALLEDRQGRRWAGTALGLCLLAKNPDPSRRLVERVFTTRDGLADNYVTALLEDAEGRIWVGTRGGLSRLEGGGRFIAYTAADGLSHSDIRDLAQDQEGNLWIGGESGGLMKLAHSGFLSYGEADGLRRARIHAILETRAGELCVVTRATDGWWLHRFDGRRFAATRPNYPPRVAAGWGWNQHVLADRRGEWWVPSSAGLWRFPRVGAIEALNRASPTRMGLEAGLPGEEVFRIFEDSRGDVWLATLARDKTALAKWERATGKVVRYPEADGAATSFREDRAGHLWIGFFWGGLARYRDGRFTFFGETDGVPAGAILDLHVDRAGRLWVASSRGGLARVDQPGEPHPRFEILTTAQGLSSNGIRCLTEDRWGRIYAGTGRGVDRLDPRTGHVRHFTTADGLAPGELNVAFADRHGGLWFGTLNGLSRLTPDPDPPRSPPPVLVTAVQAGGGDVPVSDLGESRLELPELGPQLNQLQFGFVGLGFAPGEKLLYQYILEGADRQWSAPDEQRSVRYAGLAPGSYRFRVRAINADGMASPEPAVVAFRIAPPLWLRWWFQSAAVLLAAAAIYALHRFRVAQLVRLERVRTRIASDLHDDIGAGLTRVGLLSELALRQLAGHEKAADPMARVAALSRELAESMSDIVWSVNPRRDRLLDLTQRMRRYASDVFTARQISFRFRASGPEADRRLEPEVRRQIFLIFKEAVNNIVRHSGCTEASIDFHVENWQLALRLQDNGRGFDPEQSGSGNGLRSMRQRARELRGEIEVISAPGRGATVTLRAPAARTLL